MEESKIPTIGDALMQAFEKMSAAEHVQAVEGDFVGADGYLCCGKCREHKEFRRFIPGMKREFVVPSLCRCGKEEVERQEREQQLRRERLVVDELFSYSIVDERFKESTFDRFTETPENAKSLRVARRYVDNFEKLYADNVGLLMYGPPGTGKTFAAACIANELMNRGVPVLVTSILKLTNGYSDDLQLILRKMKNARLLILDDFGAERNTEFKAEQIFDVIDTRYNSKRPMIITTNLTLDSMKNDSEMRRKRVNDRILEVCHPVKMDWQSWRKTTVMSKYRSTASLLEAD